MSRRIKDFLYKFTLYIALVPYLMFIMFFIELKLFDMFTFLMFKNSYIQQIDMPTYGNEQTKEILQEFNGMADNKIITFDKISFGRPVYITEMTQEIQEINAAAIGLTMPRLTECRVYVQKGLSHADFRETLLHEYLHCLGYDHVEDPTDLMYFMAIPVDKEENIRQYAKKVLEKFYE